MLFGIFPVFPYPFYTPKPKKTLIKLNEAGYYVFDVLTADAMEINKLLLFCNERNKMIDRLKSVPQYNEVIKHCDDALASEDPMSHSDALLLIAQAEKIISRAVNSKCLPPEQEHHAFGVICQLRRATGATI